MADPLVQFRATLKRYNQNVTAARQQIFEALQKQGPLSMAEIVKACPEIDRASVYRNISLFEKLGVVQRLQMGWKYKLELSDAFHQHHHHLSCMSCGKLINLAEDTALEKRLRLLARSHNFDMRDHQLEIQGVCEACRKT